jgi:hypothetical protein
MQHCLNQARFANRRGQLALKNMYYPMFFVIRWGHVSSNPVSLVPADRTEADNQDDDFIADWE